MDLPKNDKGQITITDSPITMAQLHKAMQHMQNNKALEQDGFPVEFYGAMASNSTHFYRMVSEKVAYHPRM